MQAHTHPFAAIYAPPCTLTRMHTPYTPLHTQLSHLHTHTLAALYAPPVHTLTPTYKYLQISIAYNCYNAYLQISANIHTCIHLQISANIHIVILQYLSFYYIIFTNWYDNECIWYHFNNIINKCLNYLFVVSQRLINQFLWLI